MYKKFYISKSSGTYADALEAHGLAFLVREVLERANVSQQKVRIADSGNAWVVESESEISSEQVENLPFTAVLKYLVKDAKAPVPTDVDKYDFPTKKKNFEDLRSERKSIAENKELSKDRKKKELHDLKNKERFLSLSNDFDVYREVVRNPYAAYMTLFDNLYSNRNHFGQIVKEIFDFYQPEPKLYTNKERSYVIKEGVNEQQLFSPNKGKGLNRQKADKLAMENMKGFWISETMKISGALKTMFCQYVKVGNSMDLKVYVPSFRNIVCTRDIVEVLKPFKAQLRSSSPIKLDIVNLLNFSKTFLSRTEGYSGRLKNSFSGFYSVYQKSLGQNRAVVNISFLETPDFIPTSQSAVWVNEILPELVTLISRIEERGDATNGLKKFRDFLGSGQIEDFFDFSFWYSRFLMSEYAKDHFYITRFTTNTLDILFQSMEDLSFAEIISNEGFQAVASAIRRSSVSLQTTPKGNRRYEIRYGLSQQLQIKSKAKKDLATFIGEFVGEYNAETARKKENALKKTEAEGFGRAFVKVEELNDFYVLLDRYPHTVIGAMLASYGFAKPKYVANSLGEEEKLRELAEKLGYDLVKRENDDDAETEETIEE